MSAPRHWMAQNHPGKPIRTFRCSDSIWLGAHAEAARRGITVTDLILEALKPFEGDICLNEGLSEPLADWERDLELAAMRGRRP
jgi:hypothetical protein